jgi:hypothetical protein
MLRHEASRPQDAAVPEQRSQRLCQRGSLDAFTDHVLSAAGGMYVAQHRVYFAVILNWDDAQAGTVASVGPAFSTVMRATFTTICDRLGA